VDAEVHGDVDALVELRGLAALHELQRILDLVTGQAVDALERGRPLLAQLPSHVFTPVVQTTSRDVSHIKKEIPCPGARYLSRLRATPSQSTTSMPMERAVPAMIFAPWSTS